MLKLVDENQAVLKQKTTPYLFEDSETERRDLESQMIGTMLANNGIGLAAPQVGLRKRFFVMQKQDGTFITCYNPEIISISEEIESDTEGCLSFPLLYLKVTRPLQITGKYQNTTGNIVVELFKGIDARCFMHELEHLDGVVFTSKVGAASLQIARQRQSKLKRTKRI
jgi:peptide deformylase